MNLLEAIASKFSSSILGYLHLWAYLDKRLIHVVSGASTHRLSTNYEFFRKLVGGEIKHGDRVIWDKIFLSEWTPRVPGGFSYLTMTSRLSEEKYFKLPTQDDGGLLTRSLRFDYSLEPYGAVRLPIRQDRRIALSGVTSSEYTIDQGVVFAVTNSVYREFLSRQLRNNAVEAAVEAFVDLGEEQSLPNLKPSNPEPDAALEQVLRKPMCILCIDSPLQVEFRTHNTHPPITAWSLRRYQFLGESFHLRGPHYDRPSHDAKIVKVPKGAVDYDFIWVRMLEDSVAELEAAAQIFRAHRTGPNFIDPHRRGAAFMQRFLAESLVKIGPVNKTTDPEVLCECDGRSPLLGASLPLNKDFRDAADKNTQLQKVLEEIRKIEAMRS